MRAITIPILAIFIAAGSFSGCQQSPLAPTSGSSEQAEADGRGLAKTVPTNEELSKRLDALADTVRSLDSKLGQLAAIDGDKELARALKEEVTTLRTSHSRLEGIVDQIAQIDSSNRTVPRVLGNMQRSPEFRTEMQRAVQQALLSRNSGQVIIENRTGVVESVFINGVAYQIAPWDTLSVAVPLGMVRVHLHRHEGPRDVPIVPPYYEQKFTIQPKPYSPPPTSWPIIVSGPVVIY